MHNIAVPVNVRLLAQHITCVVNLTFDVSCAVRHWKCNPHGKQKGKLEEICVIDVKFMFCIQSLQFTGTGGL